MNSSPSIDTAGAEPEPLDVLRRVSILVVDDEPGMRNFLRRALEKRCALLELADSVENAEQLRSRFHFDLLIVDIRLPGQSGIQWLERLRAGGIHTDVIFISAYADLEMAVAALRAGAADFILKPFRMDYILASVQRCLERRAVLRENALLRRQAQQPGSGIVGRSDAIRELYGVVERVATTSAIVLIEGETGTGKELFARAIHERSGRAGAFVAVNCGSIAPDLLESELFGHTRGAFTGAQSAREGLFVYADQGTLFLDEIAELPMALQSKLLRALEERSVRPVGADREVRVDARVVAATNRNLHEAVEHGEFRKDLFYRLNVLSIHVPALRARREDVAPLVQHFNESLAGELGLRPIAFGEEDLDKLRRYDWPGNVRELRNVIERALLLGELPSECCNVEPAATTEQPAGYPAQWSLAEVQLHHLRSALEAANGNKSAAARTLGISRKTLERKLRGA